MDKDRKKSTETENGVVPSEADLNATGTWSAPLFGISLIVFAVLVGTMLASGDASAFFGQ